MSSLAESVLSLLVMGTGKEAFVFGSSCSQRMEILFLKSSCFWDFKDVADTFPSMSAQPSGVKTLKNGHGFLGRWNLHSKNGSLCTAQWISCLKSTILLSLPDNLPKLPPLLLFWLTAKIMAGVYLGQIQSARLKRLDCHLEGMNWTKCRAGLSRHIGPHTLGGSAPAQQAYHLLLQMRLLWAVGQWYSNCG